MRSFKILTLLFALIAGAVTLTQRASAQQGSASYRLFYDELSPYGSWVDFQNYGFVWMPNVDPDFSPYVTSGRWVFTDDGWTWVSDYPWGWATFHYGRWDYDDVYGWFWVPDNEWGPAWVSWRRSPGYFGWAPLRPGISITMAFGRDYHERNERWTFVRDGDFTRPDMDHRYINRTNNSSIMNGSSVIANTQRDDRRNATYIAGPNRNDVQLATHSTVTPAAIRETGRPSQGLNNGELQVYRPQVQRGNGHGRDPSPTRISKLSDVRPASERNGGNRQQQPPVASPPTQIQPAQPRAFNAPPARARQQPAPNPPASVQPPQVRGSNQSNRRGMQLQPPATNPPASVRPPQQPTVIPARGISTPQQPPAVAPSNRGRTPQPLNLDPMRARGKEKQTQNVPPPKKVDRIQPTKNEQEKNKQDEKPKQREQ